jgi:hypothetical protein
MWFSVFDGLPRYWRAAVHACLQAHLLSDWDCRFSRCSPAMCIGPAVQRPTTRYPRDHRRAGRGRRPVSAGSKSRIGTYPTPPDRRQRCEMDHQSSRPRRLATAPGDACATRPLPGLATPDEATRSQRGMMTSTARTDRCGPSHSMRWRSAALTLCHIGKATIRPPSDAGHPSRSRPSVVERWPAHTLRIALRAKTHPRTHAASQVPWLRSRRRPPVAQATTTPNIMPASGPQRERLCKRSSLSG